MQPVLILNFHWQVMDKQTEKKGEMEELAGQLKELKKTNETVLKDETELKSSRIEVSIQCTYHIGT